MTTNDNSNNLQNLRLIDGPKKKPRLIDGPKKESSQLLNSVCHRRVYIKPGLVFDQKLYLYFIFGVASLVDRLKRGDELSEGGSVDKARAGV